MIPRVLKKAQPPPFTPITPFVPKALFWEMVMVLAKKDTAAQLDM